MNSGPTPTDFRVLFGGMPAVAITASAQAVAALLMFATWAVAACVWGPEEFGAYVVARRGVNLLNSVLGCGAFVALLRHGACEATRRDAVPQRWLFAALTIVISACGGAWLAQTLGARLVEPVASGWGLPTTLIPVLIAATLGMLLQTMLHGYLMSQQRVVEAAFLQVGATALLPLAILLLPGVSVIDNLYLLGIAWSVTAAVPATWILIAAPRRAYELRSLAGAVGETLAFGLPRVPGDFLFIGLLTLPAMLVAAQGDIITAGVFGVGVTSMAMVVVALRPCTVLLVSNVSSSVASGGEDDVWPRFKSLALTAALGSLLLASVACLAAPTVLRLYLGVDYLTATGVLQLVVLALPTLVIFVLARGVLDALERRALSTRNTAIAFTIMMACGLSGWSTGPLAGLLVGLPVLATLTVRDVWTATRADAAAISSDEASTLTPDALRCSSRAA